MGWAVVQRRRGLYRRIFYSDVSVSPIGASSKKWKLVPVGSPVMVGLSGRKQSVLPSHS